MKESNPSPVFVLGCARSGTTWLQLLLAQHPGVATSQETQLFNRYLGPLEKAWLGEVEHPADARAVGLQTVLSGEMFYAECRHFAERVLKQVACSNAKASVVVEKSPAHIREWRLVLKLFPEARFIHVIRDPRSVVASLQTAGRTWGRKWAPTRAHGCARRWLDDVSVGRQISRATARYREVRYEDLIDHGPEQLLSLYRWLGLPADRSSCERAVEACSLGNLRIASHEVRIPWSLEAEPTGFYRRGSVDAWRDELSPSEIRVIEFITQGLMRELGYATVTARLDRKPVSLAARDALRPLRDRIRTWICRTLD